MKITNEKELKDYLSELYSKDYTKYQELLSGIGKTASNLRKEKYIQNKKSYEKQKEKRERISRVLFKNINEGDVIQCHGTKDGRGYRLVLEIKDNEVHCQKLSWRGKRNEKGHAILHKEPIMTTHWDTKIKKIIDFPIEIE